MDFFISEILKRLNHFSKVGFCIAYFVQQPLKIYRQLFLDRDLSRQIGFKLMPGARHSSEKDLVWYFPS